jgi:hypothetical protein
MVKTLSDNHMIHLNVKINHLRNAHGIFHPISNIQGLKLLRIRFGFQPKGFITLHHYEKTFPNWGLLP